MPPAVGMTAKEIRPRRQRKATIVKVQADGRRIVAKIAGRPYPFTRREDGTYRLDGAPSGAVPRLVIGE